MDCDSIIKSFGVPQAVVICVTLVVGKWAAGQALAWLGDRLDKLAAFLKPHLEDWFKLMLAKLRRELGLIEPPPAPTVSLRPSPAGQDEGGLHET